MKVLRGVWRQKIGPWSREHPLLEISAAEFVPMSHCASLAVARALPVSDRTE